MADESSHWHTLKVFCKPDPTFLQLHTTGFGCKDQVMSSANICKWLILTFRTCKPGYFGIFIFTSPFKRQIQRPTPLATDADVCSLPCWINLTSLFRCRRTWTKSLYRYHCCPVINSLAKPSSSASQLLYWVLHVNSISERSHTATVLSSCIQGSAVLFFPMHDLECKVYCHMHQTGTLRAQCQKKTSVDFGGLWISCSRKQICTKVGGGRNSAYKNYGIKCDRNASTEAARLIASLHGCVKLSKARTNPYNLKALTPQVQKADPQMLLFTFILGWLPMDL